MNLLAIETSSAACSVALSLDGETSERHETRPREHTRLVVPMISGLLADGGVRAQDLDAIVLGNGPGSFIGMRIGASVAQGLAFAADLPLIPVSSLAAVAEEAARDHDATLIVVAQDARMGEVYLGRYERKPDGMVQLLGAEQICKLGAIVGVQTGFVAAGRAWRDFPELADANAELLREIAAVELPKARFLLGPAGRAVVQGHTISPEQLEPAYLRHRVATAPAG